MRRRKEKRQRQHAALVAVSREKPLHSGFRVWGLEFRVRGLGYRVAGAGLRSDGLGFRV